MLFLLDVAFSILHVTIILINLFVWLSKRFRELHLYMVGATLFSWVVLGFWKGFGYCIITDWHWDIKRKLGETDLPQSFITYLTNNLLGLNIDHNLIDLITVLFFVLAISGSIWTNFIRKDLSKR